MDLSQTTVLITTRRTASGHWWHSVQLSQARGCSCTAEATSRGATRLERFSPRRLDHTWSTIAPIWRRSLTCAVWPKKSGRFMIV